MLCSVVLSAQVKNIETANGRNVFYYPNGQIASEGNLINGIPDGKWTSYYVDGTRKSEGIYAQGQLDSVWVFYRENGLLQSQIDYREGKKNGYYYSFGIKKGIDSIESAYIQAKELYFDNQRHGLCLYYYSNEQLHWRINYHKGLINGTAREFDSTGVCITLVEYKNGREVDRETINRYLDSLQHGVWKEFYENGRIKTERFYKKGKLNGLLKSYDSNGELLFTHRYSDGVLSDTAVNVENEIQWVETYYEIRNQEGEFIKKESGSFNEGIPIGVHRTYDSTGRVNSSRTYDSNGVLIARGIVNEEGDRLGEWTFFYSNGSVKSKGVYSENRRVGPWTYYYKHGTIEQKGTFYRGVPNDLWLWYFENGALKKEEYFKLGKPNGLSTEYDEEGTLIAQGNYNEGFKEGKWIYNFYFHKEEGFYREGLREGTWTYYYTNGKKYFEGNFLQGRPDGKHVYYYRNGKKKWVQHYFVGERINNWEFYSEEGILLHIYSYTNGNLEKIDGTDVTID
ncbi:MAG: toxin-antitoxin system YwqK family antitoxin [Salinivirgaceae bacterium]